MTIPSIYILNGPNLNLLGAREPEIYGTATLADIKKTLGEKARSIGVSIDFRQTNSEGKLVDWVQDAGVNAQGLIINPGAYTHTSVALFDAISAISIPTIELHLSNIHAREEFRRRSVTAGAAVGIIAGLGAAGYPLALDAVKEIIR